MVSAAAYQSAGKIYFRGGNDFHDQPSTQQSPVFTFRKSLDLYIDNWLVPAIKMADDEQLSIYDEIEIEDMTYDPNLQIYHYPCPCGDRFEIPIDALRDGEDIGVCPSCSLMIRVIFDPVSFFFCCTICCTILFIQC